MEKAAIWPPFFVSGTGGIYADDGRPMLETLGVLMSVTPAPEAIGWHRFGDEEALHEIATELSYDCVLLIRLDTFSNDTQIHCLAERNDRLHDTCVGF
jgi:hypothetical protein